MLTLLIYWIYVFIVCTILGLGTLFLLSKGIKEEEVAPGKMTCFIAGLVAASLYAQVVSLFMGVSLIAHLGLLAICGAIMCHQKPRKTVVSMAKSIRPALPLWKALLFLGLVLVIAFFASRGPEHTDTSTYHALSIHFIEDYGIIPGLGNLMGNFAYNSTWLPLCALFSLKFVSPLSLHGLNGLLAAAIGIYALERLLGCRRRTHHVADMLSAASLFYLVVVACVLQSPATDQPAMLFSLYLLLRFAEETETHPPVSPALVHRLALISIGCVFTATLKLSAAPVALLALSCAVILIRKKEWKRIALYISCGILVLVPYIARNFFLSGYLVYPFPAIDLFNVDWKIPLERVIIDSDQIKVYGRALYENELVTLPASQWLPIWWEAQEAYEKLLVTSCFASMLGWLLIALQKKLNGRRLNPYLFLMEATCSGCLLFWFATAPWVRFGLAYLLAIPALFLGGLAFPQKDGILKAAAGVLVLAVLTCLFPFWNHYVSDDLLFAKRTAADPCYLAPKDYETFDTTTVEIGGVTFFRPGHEGKCGYHAFPACMRSPDEVTLIGPTLRDGVRGILPEK